MEGEPEIRPDVRVVACSLQPSWNIYEEKVRLRRENKISHLNILLHFRTLSVLIRGQTCGIPTGENLQAAGKAFTLPCCGPIGCQQGHLFWEEPMSDRPWLRVRPISEGDAGNSWLLLAAPACLTENRTPQWEKRKQLGNWSRSSVRISHHNVVLASSQADKSPLHHG